MNTAPIRSLAIFFCITALLFSSGCDRIKALTASEGVSPSSSSASTPTADPHTLARSQLDSQNFGNALQLAEQGLAKDGRDVDFHLIKLTALTQMKRLDAAASALEVLLRTGFKDTEQLTRDTRLDDLLHDKRYLDLINRYNVPTAQSAVRAGDAEIKKYADGSGEIHAGDVSLKIPKD
jgi:hypothetical protein